MSNTRYNPNGDFKPEALLASSRLRGIAVGMNIVCKVASVLPEEERRAMIWLANYATLIGITADALSERLDLDKAEIRAALTDPEADRTRFVRQVVGLRESFEARLDLQHRAEGNPFRPGTTFFAAYGKLADTKVSRKVRNSVRFADRSAQIIEIIGKTRMGKSVSAAHQFFRMLDRAIWVHTPKQGTERDFVSEIARSCGISVGTAEKVFRIAPRIEACLGPNLIRVIFFDEAHRLWPTDLRQAPSRIEWIRDRWETKGVSSVVLATPQYVEAFCGAFENNPRWAPGQWDGRVQRAHMDDTMSEADLDAVARHHLPGASEAIIVALVSQAKASEGFCGAMVKAIERAAFIAEVEGGSIDIDKILRAQAELARGARIATLKTSKRGSRR